MPSQLYSQPLACLYPSIPYKAGAFQPTVFLNQPSTALQMAMNGLKAQCEVETKEIDEMLLSG
jgi:hypothetical protein